MTHKTALAGFLALALLGTAAGAATIVQNGSFEMAPSPGAKGLNGRTFSSLANGSPGWDIFNALPGWTATGGAGIEVQGEKAVSPTSPLFGNLYVELDSNNNSSMRQSLTLKAGRYLLSFWYSPRALRNNTSTAETNGISYAVANVTGTIQGPGGASGTSVGTWTEVTDVFNVASDGTYNLDFAAVGTSDSYGGFIDNVSVAAVPVPAAGLLLISAMGVLDVVRRRRAAA